MKWNIFKRQKPKTAIEIASKMDVEDLRAIVFHLLTTNGVPTNFREKYNREREKEAKIKARKEEEARVKFSSLCNELRSDVLDTITENVVIELLNRGIVPFSSLKEKNQDRLLEETATYSARLIQNGLKRNKALRQATQYIFSKLELVEDIYEPSPRVYRFRVKVDERPRVKVSPISPRLAIVVTESDENGT